jgi:hypothetical protein
VAALEERPVAARGDHRHGSSPHLSPIQRIAVWPPSDDEGPTDADNAGADHRSTDLGQPQTPRGSPPEQGLPLDPITQVPEAAAAAGAATCGRFDA